MADINLTATDMKAVPVDGMINEDLMQEIFDTSPIDLPFTDSVAKVTSSSFKKDWVRESLAAASADNARVDGSDSSGDDTVVGERLSNYHQIMSKIIKVSDRGREVDSIDSSDELIRQLMKRGKEIRRDQFQGLLAA